jgi:hypothetical protein
MLLRTPRAACDAPEGGYTTSPFGSTFAPLSYGVGGTGRWQAYLTDVLTKLVNLWPASRLDELMPWAWAAERAASRRAA